MRQASLDPGKEAQADEVEREDDEGCETARDREQGGVGHVRADAPRRPEECPAGPNEDDAWGRARPREQKERQPRRSASPSPVCVRTIRRRQPLDRPAPDTKAGSPSASTQPRMRSPHPHRWSAPRSASGRGNVHWPSARSRRTVRARGWQQRDPQSPSTRESAAHRAHYGSHCRIQHARRRRDRYGSDAPVPVARASQHVCARRSTRDDVALGRRRRARRGR